MSATLDAVVEDAKDPKKARSSAVQWFKDEVLQLNFYRAHMLYFIIVILLASVIVYGEGIANNSHGVNGSKLRYIDALFLCCSAMTTTGLNTIDLDELTTFAQCIFLVLMLIGNLIFVSTFVVVIRRHYFRRKISHLIEHTTYGRRALEDLEQQENARSTAARLYDNQVLRKRRNGLAQASVVTPAPASTPRKSVQYGHGALPAPWEVEGVRKAFQWLLKPHGHRFTTGHHSYLSFEPQVDGKGRMHALNEHERAELGGVEYRALGALLWALPLYQIFWLLLGAIFLVPYSYRPSMQDTIRNAQPGNLNIGYTGFFLSTTSFTNCGLNVITSSFTPFRGYYLVLIVAGFLTYAGNTQFPILLRFFIWLTHKTLPKDSRLHQTLRFLLQHPRRCFIYLFPARETWFLFIIQVFIDLTLWVSFEVLNIGLGPVTGAIPVKPRIIDGLFQATGVRTSGGYIITLSALAPAVLVIYLINIYISSFPLILTLRSTNTYEERSVGLDPDNGAGSGLAIHLRNQLAYDLWFQLVAWVLISIIERPQITGGSEGFTLFALIFEVTSAYGTVGLSTGVPEENYSLSGQFHSLSKVIMLAVMLRGRHRGLPLAIDRSILLPGEDLMHQMDNEYSAVGKDSEADECERDEQRHRGEARHNEKELDS